MNPDKDTQEEAARRARLWEASADAFVITGKDSTVIDYTLRSAAFSGEISTS